MKPVFSALFLLTTIFLCTQCGPVEGRVYPTMKPSDAAALQAKADLSFHYDPTQKKCVNAIGAEGFNLAKLGQCGLFYGTKLKIKGEPLDMRGSLFISVQFEAGTTFDNALLDDSRFVDSSGKKLSFKKASLKRAQFKHCDFPDPTQKD